MPPVRYPFDFPENGSSQNRCILELEKPLPYRSEQGSGFYRLGKLSVESSGSLEVVLYHNPETAKFIYLRSSPVDLNLMQTVGIQTDEVAHLSSMLLPGQLCMGSERSRLISQAIHSIFNAPPLETVITSRQQHNIAIFPIAREGLKYQVSEAIFEDYGYYCDEILLDAHHVFDSSVPVYNRKVEFTLFKDKDLDDHQRRSITLAFIADSIASGLVMKEVILKVQERFDHIQRIEVIAPLATVRGISRIANCGCMDGIQVRLHVFETLLNALPPDFYYSAHFNLPELHIRPDLEEQYRAWWGVDGVGNAVADTACAGYGWSEVFYSPKKQVQMINGQLESRHNLTIVDILRRNL